MDINRLIQLDAYAREGAHQYDKKRPLYDTIINDRGKHLTGIVGPRGVGKTVLLKQLCSTLEQAFYISLDTLPDADIVEIAENLKEKLNILVLCIDEVHFQPDFEMKLKQIYDFLDIRVIFSSSVALKIFASSYDLSRRIKLMYLYPFTFSEFILHRQNSSIDHLSLNDIIEKRWSSDHIRYEYLFEEYLKGGLMPYALEEPDPLPLQKNILQKIINKDIPSVQKIGVDEIAHLNNLVAFVGQSSIDDINYSSISRNLGITKYKAESYVQLLQQAFVLHAVLPAGNNVLKEPKVVMNLPYRLLYTPYEKAIGGLREDFLVESLKMAHLAPSYLKSKRGEKTPDYIISYDNEKIVIEVGGKGKGRQQFKGISYSKKYIFTHPGVVDDIKRPLSILGYLKE